MATELLFAAVGKAWDFVKTPISRFYAKHKAKKKAFQGKDIFGQGDYYHLVKRKLKRLSATRSLPADLKSEQCRNWFRKEENIALFARIFLARWAKRSDISEGAEEQLAINYEQSTGETRRLAPGRVALAINYVYGQLTATDDEIHSLQLALDQFVAGELFSIKHPGPPLVPGEQEILHFKATAEAILEAGKHTWRMPRLVAPLCLEMRVPENNDEVHPTDALKLVTEIQSGENIVIYGSGGIGKTTLMLEMCKSCLNEGHRIPLYVDVAAWGTKNLGLFEYIATLPAAISNGITSAKLTKLAEVGKLVIMLNGWNEISTLSKRDCGRSLTELNATAGALNVVVVSRSDRDIPRLEDSKKIEVRGLLWQGQQKIVREELEEEQAESLLDLLGRNNYLRHSTRSPLILRGLVSQFSMGRTVENTSVYDLLGASVRVFEEDDQRSPVLSSEPIDSNQTAYLKEIACFLTEQQATTCTREDALQAINSAARQLLDQGQIAAPPNFSTVLNVLSSHHLLHLDTDIVRFAHQRFQEYFAAGRLLNDCLGADPLPASLKAAMNKTSWDEALELVADKLKDDEDQAKARIKLIRVAKEVDLGLACDLIGACAFSKQDDSELHDYILDRVNKLAGSPVDEIRNLGVAYQITSRLPVFADQLWTLLEDENKQNRLYTYHLNSTEISILQLGKEAETRIAAWPSDRRAEFVSETAKNSDNYEYIAGLAQYEPDSKVRSAAISIFPWEFPTSVVPLIALLDAPVEVLTEPNVVSCIQYYSDAGDDVSKVLDRIKAISPDDIPVRAQLELSLAFPDEFGPLYQDAILERLADREHYLYADDLLAIAQTYAPERLLDVAKGLAFEKQRFAPNSFVLKYQPFPPSWVGTYLQQTSEEVKSEIFEGAWTTLFQDQDIGYFRGEFFGPFANPDQIKRGIESLIQHNKANYRETSETDRKRYRQVENILANAAGDILLTVIRRCGLEATYDEVALMLEFLTRRIDSDDRGREISKWFPTVDDVNELISLLAEKEETAEDPQDLIRMHLSSIASHVNPIEFMPFIMESCRLHLDIWSAFRERLAQWVKEPTPNRPRNPAYSNYLKSALARCGQDALPGLLGLVTHPDAMEMVIEPMIRIVNEPWNSRKERLSLSVSRDIQEGKKRQNEGLVNQQPDEAFQPLTDQAAKAIGRLLTKRVIEYLEQKSQSVQFDTRVVERPVGQLAALLAGIPSPEVIEPINHALTCGLMNIYHTVKTLQGLVRQGVPINNVEVVNQLETLYQQSEGKEWFSQNDRTEMSWLIQLLLSVEPITLLSRPVDNYLEQWRQFSRTSSIIRCAGSISSETAWSTLIGLSSDITADGILSRDYAKALVSALTTRNLPDFFTLLADGSFFVWCSGKWELERLAPQIIDLLEEEPDQIEGLVEACRDAQSPPADILAGKVLSQIEGAESLLYQYLIEALDAGRAINNNMPAFHAISSLFKLKIPLGSGHYEITQRSNNDIRKQLYLRAKDSGQIADGCKRLLAKVELKRREYGRPVDELRHPAPEEDLPWDEILVHCGTH